MKTYKLTDKIFSSCKKLNTEFLLEIFRNLENFLKKIG